MENVWHRILKKWVRTTSCKLLVENYYLEKANEKLEKANEKLKKANEKLKKEVEQGRFFFIENNR